MYNVYVKITLLGRRVSIENSLFLVTEKFTSNSVEHSGILASRINYPNCEKCTYISGWKIHKEYDFERTVSSENIKVNWKHKHKKLIRRIFTLFKSFSRGDEIEKIFAREDYDFILPRNTFLEELPL